MIRSCRSLNSAWISSRASFVSRERRRSNRLSLDLRQREVAHQSAARVICVGSAADERDDGIERVERLEIPLEDVRALLCLPQLVLRAARDDLALILEVMTDQLEQRERLRDAVDERDRVVTERRLERCELEDLVERDLWHRFALELHVDAHPFLVGVSQGACPDIGTWRVPALTRSAIFLGSHRLAGFADAAW